ncbi:MAG: T9SS type A sorting domain-containing protein [Bacteroidales bacterium]|nr:T9SS type A sorting domain-containing protein [Bacteroidales bacterium]
MKTKSLLLTIIMILILSLVGFGQDISEKKYFDNNKELGGDVIIKNSKVKIDGDYIYRIFEIESPEDGNFYLSAWLMAAKTNKGYLNYDLQVNNEKQKDKIRPTKSNWQTVELKNEELKLETIKLKKGTNNISFVALAPEIPEVEFIRLTKSKDKVIISDEKYKNFINSIKEEIKERENNPVIWTDDDSSKNKIVLPNPEGNYYNHIDETFKYTTYKSFYFSSGQQVFFTTYASDKYKHVLEVFSKYHPDSYTWSDLSNSNGLASVNVRINYTGTYYVRIRSYYQNSSGLVDLNVNGQYYYNDCAVSGNGFRNAHETPENYNYFTCKLTGDSRLWISDDTWPGKIIAQNDDYYGSGDFNWGWSSRVKKDFSVRIGAALISSYGSWNPTGKCDLYIKCKNSNIMSYFPNLKADDAIQSAPASGVYNCISWSGGITGYWEWPPSYYSNYYVPGNPLASFDNFYYDIRYPGAMRFTRSGATSSNSIVDLWALNGSYTHGSVTKSGNNNPHGYDWESKPGSLMRTFHPRNALNGNSYGSVNKYYRKISQISPHGDILRNITLNEAILEGLAVMDDVSFTSNELDKLNSKINEISFDTKNEFNNKYEKWKETWIKPEISQYSDPKKYAESDEYKLFIKFCKSKGEKIWPLLIEKLDEGTFFVINPLEDLTLKENMDLLDEVKNENKLNKNNINGAYIVRSPYINAMKYAKKLLFVNKEKSGTSINNEMFNENITSLEIYPNPVTSEAIVTFNMKNVTNVSLTVCDITGRSIIKIYQDNRLKAGQNNISINTFNLENGIYIVKLSSATQTITKKFIVNK